MGLRANPSQRQRRLGHELRKLREAAGLTTAEAGRRVGIGQAHVSHIEAGRTACPEPRLHALTEAYECLNEPLVTALAEMAGASGKGWWTEFRDILDDRARDLAELEESAAAFQTFEWMYVPGLLQTPDYMRDLFRNRSPRPSEDLIDRYIDFRLHRQQTLMREPPPAFHAVIHEAAFHMHFVKRSTMRHQLLHLLELSQFDNVTIQLLPFKAEGCPAATGVPFTILTPKAVELRTVYAEQPITPIFLVDRTDVDQFMSDFDRVRTVALAPLDPSESHEKSSLGLVQHLRYVL
ncbi:helix-turn-helix transcriptional regulator [Streptomyces sodiiphilus]|uniref:Helix-turn-helix transcriptional regulator n=1 Tax=Streptomyces sodiiphilus TaxID=226217 RepID=A0ABN2PTE8_9ACTN